MARAEVDFPALKKKYPRFSLEELKKFKEDFDLFDQDQSDDINVKEMQGIFKKLGEKVPSEAECLAMIATYDTNDSKTISFVEFVGVMNDLADGKSGGAFGDLVKKAQKLVQHSSAVDGRVVHSYAEEERIAFANYVNSVLMGDKDVPLPINPDDESLFAAMADGVLLCKVINSAVPGTIFEKALNLKPKNQHKVVENQNLAINSCKSIGCQVVNIGSQDLIEGKPHLVLGLLWQIIKIGLLSNISLKNCPELIVLLNDGEALTDFMRLPPEQILLRWVNYHLKKGGSARVCSNFSGDIKDSEIYTVLMNQICPDKCSMAPMRESDTRKRAEQVLLQADRIGCRKFVTPKDIVSGNSKLNLAYTATLFNSYPALVLPADRAPLDMAGLEEDAGDSREERVFRNWMNSLPIDTFVQNLFFDTTDGVIHLETLEKIAPPGTVDWKTVTKVPKMVFKKVENANAVVLLCKQLKFSMTNIGGKDLVDMNKKLILGMTWQMMRFNLLAFLKTIGGGREIGEEDLVSWANETVKSVGHSASIASVRDGSISSGVFFFHILKAIEPDVINWEIVTPGVTDEDKKTNAMYAISVARKIGCLVFLLWEDIVEVKPKMITTFLASLMGRMILGGAIDARKAAEPPTAGVAAMKVSSAAAAPSSKPAAAGGGASSAPVLLPGQPSPAAVAKASQAAKPYGR